VFYIPNPALGLWQTEPSFWGRVEGLAGKTQVEPAHLNPKPVFDKPNETVQSVVKEVFHAG
jgi:hypothetical protein